MKVLTNHENIKSAVVGAKIRSGHTKTHSTDYPDNVLFECGCGRTHRVNELRREDILGVAMPVKFLFMCPCDFITFVQVKGLFKQKATSVFTCKRQDFVDATAP